MLNLLLGTDWTVNRNEILRRVAADVRAERSGIILIVPELISHETERRLCLAAGDTASRYAEVLSFTRLARRVADSVGSAAEACMDGGGRVVAMAAAARQLHSRLKAYASVETKPEFLTELLNAVDEFKRCCISAQDLMAASQATEGSLAQKLEELSLLLEAYDALCARGKRDPRDQMTWLLEQMEAGDIGKDYIVYIDGFPDFTRQHLAILEHLIRVAPSVTVSLNCDRPDSHLLAFEKAGSTARELIACGKRVGARVNIHSLQPPEMPLCDLRERLFQGPIRPQPVPGLTLYRVETRYQECMAAAERICALVRAGCRYRDISVVCGDMPGYQRIISLVFRRYGIPLYQSGTEDILQKPVIATVLAALNAALGGLEQADVLHYLKSVLSPLALDICDRVENYAILWGISGSRWQQAWSNHPAGLGADWTEEARTQLGELNQARALAIPPLTHLRQGLQEARCIKQQVHALYDFLEELRLAERLDALARELDAAGDNRDAQILDQLWEILLLALEQLYDVLGDTAWDGEAFAHLLTLLLSQYDVGTIPPVLDAVTAGPVSAMRCQEEKHLLVLGAEEGFLPGYGGSKGVLTDQERVALRALGVPLTGGAMEGLQAEFAEIYGVFCGARETVTVSCPSGQASFVYRRLLEMAGRETVPDLTLGPAQTDPQEAGAYLARWNAAAEAAALRLSEVYADTHAKAAYSLGAVSPENIRRLYGEKLKLSATQVDRQADCRLGYFLKYGIRAQERKEVTIDPAEFGTYVHAVLEQTARRVMELGGFHGVSWEKTQEIAAEYSESYAKERFGQLDTQRLTYLFQRNSYELELVLYELWQELGKSRFAPVEFELAFGDGEKMPAIRIPGGEMEAQLRGFVDRVDSWQAEGRSYFRVVDYKTGKKNFDYCDIFNGLGLQMLLYLYALEESGGQLLGKNAIPAGVQYFPARVPLLSADGKLTDADAEKARLKEWKRKGLLLLDEAALEAMEPGGNPQRLCCTRRKDGSLSGDLADREQFRLLRTYLYRVLAAMVTDIASGNVEPNPYTRGSSHNACTFCPYGAVCHQASVAGRRNYKAMTAKEFWDRIGKELNQDG